MGDLPLYLDKMLCTEERKKIVEQVKVDLEYNLPQFSCSINEANLEKLREYIIGKALVVFDNENALKEDINNPYLFPYNNLILVVEEEDYDPYFPRFIGRMITDDKVNSVSWMAESVYRLFAMYKLGKDIAEIDYNEKNVETTKGIIEGEETIIIKDFERHPVLDKDLGTGRELTQNKELVEAYEVGMEYLSECIRENPLKNYIIVTNRQGYKDYKQDHEIFYRTFKYHVFLDGVDVDSVVDSCFKIFDDDIQFDIAKGYKEKLEEYVRAVYPSADLRGERFVDDLRNRILTNYYSDVRSDLVITPDLIPAYRGVDPDAIFDSLKDIVGMENVKNELRTLYKDSFVSKKINKKKTNNLNMIFTGNPGTGKTTIAQKLADLYHTMGITRTSKLVSIKVGDLVSMFQGGTTQKALSVIERAYGGVLFIDEAYGFLNGQEKEKKALEVLIQEMENNRDNLVVILAGYPDEMKELMKLNPGLKSRIGKTIHFEDYTDEELVEIFKVMCKAEGFKLAGDATPTLQECIMARKTGRFFGNAREVRNIFEASSREWSVDIFDRAEKAKRDVSEYPLIIEKKHLEKLLPEKHSESVVLEKLVGLDSIKTKLQQFKNQVVYKKFVKERGMNIPDFSMHMIFMGNPGTGKTTVAKLIADELYSSGVLKTNRVSVKERKDLVGEYVGKTAIKTREVVEDAKGGVLFIDEAYSLAKGDAKDFGAEAIDTLIVAMEEFKDDTVFIFAGYTDQMQTFIESNPGIKSRIGYTFNFDDYSVDQLMQIYDKKMSSYGFVTESAALKKIRDIMEYFKDSRDFGNGRFVEHVIQQIINKRGDRFTAEKEVKNYSVIKAKDVPSIAELLETSSDKFVLHDPKKLSADSKRRTAVHELGHAIAQYALNSELPPKVVSIKSHAGSLGRIEMTESEYDDNLDETYLRNHIVTLLAGRNAERMIYGCNASGVSSDYSRAKKCAKAMIEDYAMGEIGVTTDMDILREEDERCKRLLEEKKDVLLGMVDELLEKEEIQKNEFVKLYKKLNK